MIMKSNPEAKAMSNLPLDIALNIFSRLPVKSLGQLKCTCKSWNSLISSPQFRKLRHDKDILDADVGNHFRLFMYMIPNRSYLLDYESPSSVTDLSRSFQVNTDEIIGENLVNHVGSCYGFVYFVCFDDCITVWNPCTNQAKNLPNSPTPYAANYSYARYFYGLGYENGNTGNEYKMVRIIQSGFPKLTEVEVFDVRKSSSWRSIEAFDSDITILKALGTFANGALHWKATRGTGSEQYEMILSFDIRSEKFREISLPKFGDGRIGLFWLLGDSKGRLVLQVGGDCNDLDVWAMEDYGVAETWIKLVTYKLRDFGCSYGLRFVCFTKNGDGLLNDNGYNLVRFDTLERRSRYYKKFHEEAYFDCFMYVESLVSPHGDSLVV